MKRILVTLVSILVVTLLGAKVFNSIWTASASDVFVAVAYPAAGDNLPYLKQSFVFGAAAPGSTVTVNGMAAFVASAGGWIAYVPFEPGKFHLRAVAERNSSVSASFDWDVNVAKPLVTLPEQPARIDPLVPPAPAEDMTLQPGDTIRLFIKASTGARVRASAGSIVAQLTETSAPKFVPSEQQRILGDMVASGESIGGLYEGELKIPAAASGTLRVDYTVESSDGSVAQASAHGTINLEAPGSYRVGYVVLEDHRKNIDARPYGVIESAPDGGWLFFPPAHTPFKVTGSDGSYYRVQLGANQTAWIAKRSLMLVRPGTPSPHASVRGVVIRDEARRGTVIAHLSERVPFSIEESVSNPSLRVVFYGASASTDFVRYGNDRSNIGEIRWAQLTGDNVAVTIYLRQRTIWGYHAAWNGNDFELAIKKPPRFKPAPASALSGLLVVIDPGHSPDSGAIGPLGTEERNINLSIAERLKAHLERLGARAVLTRTANVPLGLYDRTAIAERLNADILISVHNNALPDGVNPFTHHGFSVYYYQAQSLALARAIHAAYQRRIQLPDYGLYYDNLALTRPTEEPAVLTESAFMMWPPEEALLRDASFQDKLARTMSEGIEDWLSAMRALH